MKNNLITIKSPTTHEIEIKKSRFICHLARVESEQQAKLFIASIKKEHYNATHNCSCYCIGDHQDIQKAHDDGEPSGTAGVPMLEVLKKQHITNTVAVVTRYYGGTKLGAGGLIRAYGKAVSQAIQQVGLVRKTIVIPISVTINYTLNGKLEHELHRSSYIITDVTWTDVVTYHIQVMKDDITSFHHWIDKITNHQHQLTINEPQYVELNYQA